MRDNEFKGCPLAGTITRSYDALDRLISEVTPQGSVTYAYDAAGRRTSMTVSGQSTVNYSYDNANHLTQIAQGSATVTIVPDADGRRQSLTLPNGVSMNYGYDAASQLLGITYKLGADGTNTYTWNARNQLVSISGAVSASFQYDAFGRRVSKTIGATTQFLYDAANPVQEISGTSVSANLLTGGIDEYFQRTDLAGARSYFTDALGSTIALADSTGTVQTSYTFEPFGNTTTTGTATSNSFAYTGRELDATGLYFYRARYYNPQVQRFISEDPIGVRGGINKYAYVGNNPTSLTDPSGQNPIALALCIGGAGVGAAAYYGIQSTAGRKRTWSGYAWSALAGCGSGLILGFGGGLLPLPFAAGGGVAAAGVAAGAYSAVAANGARGLAFQQAATQALNEVQNEEPIVNELGTSVPDIMNPSAITEIKDVAYQSFTQQMQIQQFQALQQGIPYNVIVNGSTQVSGPLLNAVLDTGGTVMRFNPATGAFTPY